MRRLAVCLIVVLFGLGPPDAPAASFQGLGDLPGGLNSSLANGVSADGSVVVGHSQSASGYEAFRWTADGGMVGLGDLPTGDFDSRAYAVSADGSVVVGWSRTDSPPAYPYEAFRWTQSGGMVGLGDLEGGAGGSDAYGVSADGSVVVGESRSGIAAQAFRWTTDGGMLGLGDLDGGIFWSDAEDVSADGSVVVGYGNSTSGPEAFRWTQSGSMVGLGDLPDGSYGSIAWGVSADGSTVVGQGESVSGSEAFHWTTETPMVGLGDLPGGDFRSCAYDVSADGSIIVGYGSTASGQEAFLFDGSMHNLKEMLTEQYGLDLTGWTLESAEAVSPNGRAIVGWGTNPSGDAEAWRVLLDPLELNWISSTSGSWDDAENWDFCHPATDVTDVYIQPLTALSVLGPAGFAKVKSVTLDCQFSTASLCLQASGKLAVMGQTLIDQGGRLTGEGTLAAAGGITNWGEVDLGTGGLELSGGLLRNFALIHDSGRIHNVLHNQPSGEVRVQNGQRIVFTAGGNVSSGKIEVIGGEIEFAGGLYNEPSLGLITASDARLRFGTGLANEGSLGITFGTTHVFGDVTNDGTIVVSGNSNVTFYDDVANNTSIQVSKGSTLVFFGAHTGGGTLPGAGTVLEEGDLRPGASTASVFFGGNLVFGSAAGLEIELNGTSPGSQYDQLDVVGTVSLGGASLNLSLGYLPDRGDTFVIVNNHLTDPISGEFAGMPDDSSFTVNDVPLQIDYQGGDGNDVALTVPFAEVTKRNIFYHNSAFDVTGDDPAVATDKVALQPGDPQATCDNYTSYSRGINGIVIEMDYLLEGVTPGTGDFEFTIGNDDTPGDWDEAPTPEILFDEGQGYTDRVTLTWEDYQIRNTWLEVTVLAAGLEMEFDDTFYFGNAVGEACHSGADAEVNETDVLLAQDNPHNFFNPAGVTCPYDYNRDGRVNATDMLISRSNPTDASTALRLISVPEIEGTGELAAVPEPSALALLGVGALGLLAYSWRKRRCR